MLKFKRKKSINKIDLWRYQVSASILNRIQFWFQSNSFVMWCVVKEGVSLHRSHFKWMYFVFSILFSCENTTKQTKQAKFICTSNRKCWRKCEHIYFGCRMHLNMKYCCVCCNSVNKVLNGECSRCVCLCQNIFLQSKPYANNLTFCWRTHFTVHCSTFKISGYLFSMPSAECRRSPKMEYKSVFGTE